jgi:hypothetical protein
VNLVIRHGDTLPYPQKIQPIILTEPQIQDYQARRRPRKMAIELCPV